MIRFPGPAAALLALAGAALAGPLPTADRARTLDFRFGPGHLLCRPAAGAAPRWDLPPPRETHRRMRIRVDGDRVVARIHQVFFNASYQHLETYLLAPDPGPKTRVTVQVRAPELASPPPVRPLGAAAAAALVDEFAATGGYPAALARIPGPGLAYGPIAVGRGEYLKVDWRFERRERPPAGGLHVLAVAPGARPPRPLALDALELDLPDALAGQTFSSTHRLLERPGAKGRVLLNPVQDGRDPTQPLVVLWPRVPGEPGVLRGTDPDGGGLALALVPPAPEPPSRRRRCWVVALDTGGSLRGGPFERALERVEEILGLLTPEDLFDLVPFASFPQPFLRHPTPATPGNVSRALAFLADREPVGAVNFEAGLLTALEVAQEVPEGADPAVLLLTDGRPTFGENRADAILQQRPDTPVPIFPVASGADTDYFFLEQLARTTGGTAIFLEPGEDATPLIRARVRPRRGAGGPALTLDGAPLEEPAELRHDGARVVTFRPGDARELRVGPRRFALATAQPAGPIPHLIHRARDLGARVWRSLQGREKFPGGALSFRLLGLVPGTPRPRILHTLRDGVGPLGRARMLTLQGLLDQGIFRPVTPGPNRAWSGNRFFEKDADGIWLESGLARRAARPVDYGSAEHRALFADPRVRPHLALDRQVALFVGDGGAVLVRPAGGPPP